MSRAEEIISRFELRRNTLVKGVEGQKMDEACIQKFIESDPSGNSKYLEWMLYQAGGGKDRLDKSTSQWEKGDHGEPPVRETLKEQYIKDCLTGYKDDSNNFVPPVPQAEAERLWTEAEPRLRRQHIYGDEDYAITGFGFYRSWPGHNNLYEQIVQTVHRFHRYQQALKSQGKSVDLSVNTYPNLRDLMEALQDLTLIELKNDVLVHKVYEDELLVVMVPFTIGASIKFGIPKWCTSCESMMKQALAGQGPNRWKEYAKDNALYYCKFKNPGPGAAPWNAVAVQVPHKDKDADSGKYWNAEDTQHTKESAMSSVSGKLGAASAKSFRLAIAKINAYHPDYPVEQVVLETIVRS